jgi:transcriptional regulator with XRE-family HTH domain
MEKFALPLGVGKTAISKIESGERGVTDQIRRAIAREYHVNYNWLLTGEGTMHDETSKDKVLEKFFSDIQLDEGFKNRFVRALAQLDERDWEAVEKMAKLIYDQEQSKQINVSVNDITVEEAEASYKKAVLNSAKNTGYTASSTTEDIQGRKEA